MAKPRKRKPQKSTQGHSGRARTGEGAKKIAQLEERRQRAQGELDEHQAERERFKAKQRQDLAKALIELDAADQLLLGYVLRYPKLSQQALGDLVGLGREAVNKRVNAPKFQRALAEAGREALDIFNSNKAAAARKLGQLIHDPDSRIAIRAAIAHLWPTIHADAGGGEGDFVKLIQEAYEAAERTKQGAAPREAPGGVPREGGGPCDLVRARRARGASPRRGRPPTAGALMSCGEAIKTRSSAPA